MNDRMTMVSPITAYGRVGTDVPQAPNVPNLLNATASNIERGVELAEMILAELQGMAPVKENPLNKSGFERCLMSQLTVHTDRSAELCKILERIAQVLGR